MTDINSPMELVYTETIDLVLSELRLLRAEVDAMRGPIATTEAMVCELFLKFDVANFLSQEMTTNATSKIEE